MQTKMKLAIAASLVLMLCGASFAQEQDHNRVYPKGSRDGQNDRARNHSYRAPDRHQDRYHGNGQYDRYPNRPYVGSGNGTYAHSPYYGNGQYGSYPNVPYGGYGNGTYGYSPYYGNGQYGRYPNGPYGGYGGTYGNGGYGTYGQYGNYGGNAQSVAYNQGYQTGLSYGAADRNNGHSYRPTYSSTYQHGTSGYNSSMGSQTAYKNAFRQGYQAGYQRGYGGGGYGGYGGRRY